MNGCCGSDVSLFCECPRPASLAGPPHCTCVHCICDVLDAEEGDEL